MEEGRRGRKRWRERGWEIEDFNTVEGELICCCVQKDVNRKNIAILDVLFKSLNVCIVFG